MPILLYLWYKQMRFIVILLLPLSFYCFMTCVINHYETIVAQYLRDVPYLLLTNKLCSCTTVVMIKSIEIHYTLLRLFESRM